MTGAAGPAWRQALGDLARGSSSVAVIEAGAGGGPAGSLPGPGGPTRAVPAGPDWLSEAVARSSPGPAFVLAPVDLLFGRAYGDLVHAVVLPRRNVKLLGSPAGSDGGERDDLGASRGLPSLAVAVPADGAAARAAVLALAGHAGPAYLRLPPEDAPSVTGGTFELGRACELRGGSDLAIVAVGAAVAGALGVAADLARIGLSVRVLDVASVQPFDEPAILRAARDTGAILVLEPGPLSTGIGCWVAAMTSENVPVPVRRLRFGGTAPAAGPGPAEEVERARDEAWELLRLRGKAP
jgi:transketolase C-terminal domain/subunit